MRRGRLVKTTIAVLWGLVALVPTLWIIVLSLRSESGILTDPTGLPGALHGSNYVRAWSESGVAREFVNTAVVTGVAVAVVLASAALFAFAVSRIKFGGSHAAYLTVVAGLAIPGQVTVLPLYILMKDMHLINSLVGIVIIYSATGIPFAVFILATFIENVPRSLDEAAMIDGATSLQVARHVIVPLLRPALGIVAVFNIINDWNNFLIPLIFLQKQHDMTVSVGVFSFVGQYGTTWNYLLALLVIVSAPLVIVFLVMADQFKQALLGGALKM